MIRTISLFWAGLCLAGASWMADACSVFASKTSDFSLMAKSYDFQLSHGIALINKRNIAKVALVQSGQPAAQWTSLYGSVTYTQFGRDFPLSGMNEKGLAIEILWDFDTSGPTSDGVKPQINEAQWIQYQLDRSATVRDVIENTALVNAVKVFAPVHYLVCDVTGACAVFEFNKTQMTVHENSSMPVLTNTAFASALSNLGRYVGFGGAEAIPFGSYESNDRFAILASQLSSFTSLRTFDEAKEKAFETLKMVRKSGFTRWNLVHNLRDQVSYLKRTFDPRKIRRTDLKSFNLSCLDQTKIVDLEGESEFSDYDPQLNRETVELSGQVLGVDARLVEAVVRYPESTRCLE